MSEDLGSFGLYPSILTPHIMNWADAMSSKYDEVQYLKTKVISRSYESLSIQNTHNSYKLDVMQMEEAITIIMCHLNAKLEKIVSHSVLCGDRCLAYHGYVRGSDI